MHWFARIVWVGQLGLAMIACGRGTAILHPVDAGKVDGQADGRMDTPDGAMAADAAPDKARDAAPDTARDAAPDVASVADVADGRGRFLDTPGIDMPIQTGGNGDAASPEVFPLALPQPGCGGVFSGGSVVGDFSLTKACSPYVIRADLYVSAGTLVIEAGTTVLFEHATSLTVGGGRLEVRGTADAPVVFDSYRVDPAPGDWTGLRFLGVPAEPSRIQSAILRHCGWEMGNGCLWLSNAGPGKKVTFDGVSIAEAKDHGLVATGNNEFSVMRSTFGVSEGAFAIRLFAPQFPGIGPGNTFGAGTIGVDGGRISGDTRWNWPGADVVVTSTLTVGDGGKPMRFTIGPGMRLRFNRGAGLDVDYNEASLSALGSAEAPVVFSSSAREPAPGDWPGIRIYGGRGIAGATFSHTIVEFAGGESWGHSERGGIIFQGAPNEAVVTDSLLRYNAGQAIRVDCAAMVLPVLTGTRFEGNASDPDGTGSIMDNVGPGPMGSPGCLASTVSE